ncbi:uncharacterized protein JCM10292_000592 [Rhodotorula paludigena]|uniref:uncharacterized protein n=1 Tax=Rhodotorula paludigena TaxID=86838 RepID=UPI00317DBB26
MLDVEHASYDRETFLQQLERVNELIAARARGLEDLPVTATKEAIEHALEVLPDELPAHGLGLEGALGLQSSQSRKKHR